MRLKWSCIALMVLALCGCAGIQVAQRSKELNATMNSLFGKSTSEVVMVLGAPREVATIAGLEVYKYYQSYGVRAQAAVAPNPYLVSGSGNAWESYDKVTVYFKDDKMVKWDGYVQR